MPSIIESEVVADVIVVEPDRHGDERGRFVETYRRSWFPLGREMVQGNRSENRPVPWSACTTTCIRPTTGTSYGVELGSCSTTCTPFEH